MAFVNYLSSTVAIKIVYYGPGLSGKTTNLKHIAAKLDSSASGELICLETSEARTYFFDLLFVKAGLIGDFKVHFQLMTCPGQVFYEASRKSVLSGLDGLVFVADSQSQLFDANLRSLESLRRNLDDLHIDVDALPVVFQYNKRDLDDLTPVEMFNSVLNTLGRPYFEAAAIKGQGVFETLRGIASLTIPVVRQQIMPGQDEAEEAVEEIEEKVELAIDAVRPDPPAAPSPESARSAAKSIRPAEQPAAGEACASPREDICRDMKKIKLKSEKDLEQELANLTREFSEKN